MNWDIFLTILHIIGTAFGVGGATVGDFMFFRILKNKTITKTEVDIWEIIARVIWFGLLILVFSGFGFLILARFQGYAPHLIYNAKFLVKYTIVFIIFINGLMFHWKVFPVLRDSVGQSLRAEPFLGKSRLIFTVGAISIVSWYATLILGAWRDLNLSYLSIFGIYLIALALAIAAANIIGGFFIKNE